MGRRLRILVVEDSPEDRELYRRLLARGGLGDAEVVEHERGEDGLAALEAGPFDCVLLDYRLPDLDGLEFLDRLGSDRVTGVPVILLTGHGDERTAVEAMQRGVQDYLVKGRIDRLDLARSVRNAIEKAGLRRRIAERTAELENEIRERRRAQEELRSSYDRLEELVQQRTEELERANRDLRAASRLKDEFLATLSHELRTPLNAVLGWAAVLRTGRVDDVTAGRALEAIERNAQAQARIIADLLDVSGIITGKLRVEPQAVDPRRILGDVENTLRHAAEAKRIRLAFDPTPEVTVFADPARLQQIVWNLVSNAVKFSNEGGSVHVRTRVDGSELEIEVTDDGIGISEEFLPFVFDRFRQHDGSTTRRHGGMGLGLAIVRHLVELHGGTVSAASDGDGHGATFHVRLPLRSGERHEADSAPDDAATEWRASLAGKRVLVVDDEPETLELCRTVLRDAGAQVEVAESAETAVALFLAARPDVLVSDIGLPGQDGYSLMRWVRGLRPEQGAGVPAAALTAYAAKTDERRAHEAGFDAHLAKPVTPRQLVQVVRTLADGALSTS